MNLLVSIIFPLAKLADHDHFCYFSSSQVMRIEWWGETGGSENKNFTQPKVARKAGF